MDFGPWTLDQLLADHQPGHSEYQIDHFIVGRGNWTPWGRYRQALREIDKRLRGLSQLRDDRELAQVDLEELERTWVFRAATRRRNAVKHRRLEAQIQFLNRDIAECERELARLTAIAQGLKTQLGDLSPERRAALEEETWETRLRAMAGLDILTQGRITEQTLSLLLSLPRSRRDPILREVQETMESVRCQREGPLVAWLETIGDEELVPPGRIERQ